MLAIHKELNRDPTRSTTLRRKFEGEASRRFRHLKGLIRKAIVEQDVLGLRGPVVQQVPPRRAFDFPRSDAKVAGFMQWLADAENEGILEVRTGVPVSRAAEQAWTGRYIETAYQKGIAHAGQQMRKQGAKVSDRWVSAAFNRPVHADRVGLMYTRVFEELKGITAAMDAQISRELAQALAEGVNPEEMARRLTNRVDRVGRTRARVLARTETIRAHAEATLNAYEEAGAEGVEVQAEWSTAGDNRVCRECSRMEGRTFSMKEARGMIPRHPNCRCAFTPVLPNPSQQIVG